MRLYHRTNFIFLRSLLPVFLIAFISGCVSPQVTQRLITIRILADKSVIPVQIAAGSSVREALNVAGLTLGERDRIEPPVYTILTDSEQVKVIRVREEIYTTQEVIPFEHQEIRNEALPEGERRLSQAGVNGFQEVTYRRIFEDDVEQINNIIKKVVFQEAIPEVVMVGSHSSLSSLAIPGKLAFLSAGNAWVIERSTKNRILVVSSGDLDGRIFSLSKDGKYLLFTRFSHDEMNINSLWMALFQGNATNLIDLGVKNIVHFADFNPTSTAITYSTADWRDTSPGWHANNDLYEIGLDDNGGITTGKEIIGKNFGGLYGWWGTDYTWSPDGSKLLLARPDGLRIFDIYNETEVIFHAISPLQTGGNWAWIPNITWSPDGTTIYTIDHDSTGLLNNEKQPQFNLMAIPLKGGTPIQMVTNVGIFANPIPSPLIQSNGDRSSSASDSSLEGDFSIAYLKAIFPDKGDTSTYGIYVMNSDGSNQRLLFPGEGLVGLDPQSIVWSSGPIDSDNNYAIAFIYNGNIWLVNSVSGVLQQITEDGATSRLDWR